MLPQALIHFKCMVCAHEFAALSNMYFLAHPVTKEPIKCDKCGSKKLKEIETIQVG